MRCDRKWTQVASEVRAELEAALEAGPTGDDEVAESLQTFPAAGRNLKHGEPTTAPELRDTTGFRMFITYQCPGGS